MDLNHLKYAVEVEKTKSITKAAENLFMGQPNLSRAIRDLEEILGIRIFRRTSRGVVPAQQGEEFLTYAKNILNQVDEMEALYRPAGKDKLLFSISVPRASYISYAFSKMVAELDLSTSIEFHFKETNNMEAINNILQNNYHLGILRYQSSHEKYFTNVLRSKELAFETIWEFEYLALMSEAHPLAKKKDITYADLSQYIEIAHEDMYVPSLPLAEVKKTELPEWIKNRIFVMERGSQFDLLCMAPTTYIWVSAIPAELLRRYSLVQRKCREAARKYKDVLIYGKNYRFSELDNKFLDYLEQSKTEVSREYD